MLKLFLDVVHDGLCEFLKLEDWGCFWYDLKSQRFLIKCHECVGNLAVYVLQWHFRG